MNENQIATLVIEKSLEMHKRLGPGLLESTYEKVLFYELQACDLLVSRQVAIPLTWKNLVVEEAYRADLIVDGKVIVEIKSLEKVAPVHQKQLLTYLRLSGLKLGLLINFGQALLKDGLERVINGRIEPSPHPKGLFH
jgi:GxxExxY protein